MRTSISSGMPFGARTNVVSARGHRTNSAWPPSTVFAGAELPNYGQRHPEFLCLWSLTKQLAFRASRCLSADAVVAASAGRVERHDDLMSSCQLSCASLRVLPLAVIVRLSVSSLLLSLSVSSCLPLAVIVHLFPVCAPTLSPMLKLFTSSPFSTISPTNSCPQMKFGGHFRCPR